MRIIQKILSLLLLGVLILVGITFFTRNRPISAAEVMAVSLQAPQMKDQLRFPESFSYEGIEYEYRAKANYELWGLVTADENLNNIFSLSRAREAIGLKNICVTWGNNLKGGAYLNVRYHIRDWVCTVSGSGEKAFNVSMMSYNHLLAENPEVQQKIKGIRVGDQIHLEGYLVDYTNKRVDWEKRTSLSLEDEGVHSAEVFMVTEVEILKQGNVRQHLFFSNGLKFFVILLFVKIVLVFMGASTDLRILQNYEDKNKF